jgi:tetratricopeptide (TPR) repeat protein
MENPLQIAIHCHRRGQIQDAARRYQAILARSPDHPEALHLLGLISHQLNRHQEATEMIARAIALRPTAAAYHANLAEVLRALGHLDKAIDCCCTAIRLQPDYPEAINNLGLALLQSGRAFEALDQFRTAMRLRPGFAAAHNNLANTLRALGDESAAIEQFRLAVQCDPKLAEAHSNLGQLLCERQQLSEALEHCRQAVRLWPEFAEAHSNLGNVLRELGRLDEARRHYTEAMRLNSRIGMVYNNMAQLLQEEGQFEGAQSWYQQALTLDPGSPRIHCNLASLLCEQERYEEAASRYEAALRLDSRSAQAHNGLGSVCHEQGRHEEAKEHFQAALRLKPDFTPTLSNLGVLLQEVNDVPGAESAFRAVLHHDPNHCGALSQLATMLRGKLPEDDLAAMRALLVAPELADGKRALLHFGLAQVLDARAEYAEAAEHLRHANGLALAAWRKHGEAYDPAAHASFVSEMISTCTPEFFERVRGLGLDSERPVFIVGLPRSGTTLVEQVLASHSRIFGAGELRLACDHFEALPAVMNRTDSAMASLSRLDRESIHALGSRYLDRLHALNTMAIRIVDKMPDNYMYLGMLAALFPGARFIHCRRDLRDIAVSCWMTSFRRIRWANDLGHIASRFAEYTRLMEHWRATLPVPVLEVSYEETVADLEGVTRRLVAWCGLEWEPACLEFHKCERPVRTASVTQVRQPLYTHSVARWKKYEPALGDLFAQLVPSPVSGDPDPRPYRPYG